MTSFSNRSLSIIGMGAFGRALQQVCQKHFHVPIDAITTYSRTDSEERWKEACEADIIFPCTPIALLPETVERIHRTIEHTQQRMNQIVWDVTSIKLFPEKVFSEKPRPFHTLLTHPMWWPQSLLKNSGSVQGLKWVFCGGSLPHESQTEIIQSVGSTGFTTIEMTSDEHDRLAARTQLSAYALGRILRESGFGEHSPINTLAADWAANIMENHLRNDALFADFIRLNPHAHATLEALREWTEVSLKALFACLPSESR